MAPDVGDPAPARPGRGLFITFEGGEGSGKSTQVRLLKARLEALGHTPVATREPGGSEGADAIRSLLVTGDVGRWRPMSELFLIAAARYDHVCAVIAPALEAGRVVLCDRFSDSTMAYQGHGHGLERALITAVNGAATGGLVPDLTLILDLPVEEGLSRAAARGGDREDRFERMGTAFHTRLREGFHTIAKAEPARCRLIDAAGAPEDVAGRIWACVEPVLVARHQKACRPLEKTAHGTSA